MKLKNTLLSMFSILATAAVLASCAPNHTHTYSTTYSSDDTNHWYAATCDHTDLKKDIQAHTWNSGVITTPATEEIEGVKTYTCTVCGKTKTEKIDKLPHTHTYSTTYSADDNEHFYAATCSHTNLKKDNQPHNLNDYVCSVCGYQQQTSEGLRYVESMPYAVCGIGSFEGENLRIPLTHDGTDITTIDMYAFRECTSIKTVTMGSNIYTIDEGAFSLCTELTSIKISSSVANIWGGAFEGCTSLTTIIVDENNTVYDSRDNCNAIIKTDTNTLLFGCKGTVIPKSVTTIASYAFAGLSSLTSITYSGTKEEWNSITKELNWDYSLENYTIHCTNGDI